MSEKVAQDSLSNFAEVLPLLQKIPIFGGLDESQLKQIFKRLKRVSYLKDEVIFREKECATYIYIVEKGRVKLVFDEAGLRLTKAELEPGTCFGKPPLSVSSLTPLQRYPWKIVSCWCCRVRHWVSCLRRIRRYFRF